MRQGRFCSSDGCSLHCGRFSLETALPCNLSGTIKKPPPSAPTPLGQRVYTSRLLGRNPELVLHGGGNTSVKTTEKDFFGDDVELCHVKGSGWDLATIEREGFSPVRMSALLKMAELPTMSDSDMVLQQRAAMTNPNAPAASIEAILHAIIPFKFVDHSHANAISALTCSKDGEARVKEVFGQRVIIVPYVMPGFILAKTVYDLIEGPRPAAAESIDGLVLLKHGLFTFADDAKTSYELHIELVTKAEEYSGRAKLRRLRNRLRLRRSPCFRWRNSARPSA